VTRKLSVSLCVFRAPFIHDIELTGGIETSIRGAREQLTIARRMWTPTLIIGL
jgi:hypothetical protein